MSFFLAEAVTSQEIPQDVAFIVAPMQPGASEENMNLTVANSAAESSYVQVCTASIRYIYGECGTVWAFQKGGFIYVSELYQ